MDATPNAVSLAGKPPSEGGPRPDDYAGDLPHRLPKEQLLELSKLDPLRVLSQIAFEWAGIVGAIALCERFWHPLLYIVAVLWIGGRQHGLAVLMHEGTHQRILKKRFWNDLVSDLFLAWPIFITNRGFRRTHWAHHRHVNSPQDPDWVQKMKFNEELWKFPKTRRQLALMLLLDVSGLNCWVTALSLVGYWRSDWPKGRKGWVLRVLYHAARLAYYALALWALLAFGLWKVFALYWLVPLFTWFTMSIHIRSISEHFAVENDHLYTQTRTTYASLLERLFLIPNNINYHIDHHLYPGVPFHRLPELNEALLLQPGFKEKAHLTRGYWRVLKECTRPLQAVGGAAKEVQ